MSLRLIKGFAFLLLGYVCTESSSVLRGTGIVALPVTFDRFLYVILFGLLLLKLMITSRRVKVRVPGLVYFVMFEIIVLLHFFIPGGYDNWYLFGWLVAKIYLATLVFINLADDRRDLWRAIRIMLAMALPIGVLYFQHINSFEGHRLNRFSAEITGINLNVNAQAHIWLVMVTPVMGYLDRRPRFWYFWVGIVLGGTLLFTVLGASRSSLIILSCLTCFYLGMMRRRHLVAIVLVIVALTMGAWYVLPERNEVLLGRMDELTEVQQEGRWSATQQVLLLTGIDPVWGYGHSIENQRANNHIFYLNILLDYGLIGSGFLIALALAFIRPRGILKDSSSLGTIVCLGLILFVSPPFIGFTIGLGALYVQRQGKAKAT